MSGGTLGSFRKLDVERHYRNACYVLHKGTRCTCKQLFTACSQKIITAVLLVGVSMGAMVSHNLSQIHVCCQTGGSA
jgi:hypothetical protein